MCIRDSTQAVKKTLNDLTHACRSGKRNLLALAIEAARCRATLGEISDACEAVSVDTKLKYVQLLEFILWK